MSDKAISELSNSKDTHEWWRVEVITHDGTLIAIEPGMLAGKHDLTDIDAETIRYAAENLWGFIGNGEESDFLPE